MFDSVKLLYKHKPFLPLTITYPEICHRWNSFVSSIKTTLLRVNESNSITYRMLCAFQVINKSNDSCFTPTDEKVFSSYLQFCGIGLKNAQLYEKSQLEVKRNQVLLDLARMIFEEQSTMEHMVFRILTHTQSLIQCQRVQVGTHASNYA